MLVVRSAVLPKRAQTEMAYNIMTKIGIGINSHHFLVGFSIFSF